MILLSQYVKELTNYPFVFYYFKNNYLVDVQNPILLALLPHPVSFFIRTFSLLSAYRIRIITYFVPNWWRISESNR